MLCSVPYFMNNALSGKRVTKGGSMQDAGGEYAFSTKPLVESLDWYYYGFRYYDPLSGRWLSRDPIGEAGGLNIYRFTANNALNYLDILGALPYSPYPGSGVMYPGTGPGGVTPPPKPSGHNGFHHYGNWGGPGWANGEWRSGSDPLPGPGDPDYNPPVDARDACYEGHDRCIYGCPDKECYPDKHSDCMEGCDHDLADCLRKSGNGGPESLFFDTIIPWIWH